MLAHYSTRRVVENVLGPFTPISQISREACRELLDILRWIPVNVAKKFPRLTVREAAERAKQDRRITTINATNQNAYMSRLSTMLNWAVSEEYLGRNPARGLQWADIVHPKDRRQPFASWQLTRIFSSPNYTGDASPSAGGGSPVATGAKYWVPLLALVSGARLNELCQLDV
jgi:integrase